MSLPRLNLFLGIFLSAGTCLALNIRTRSGVTYKHVKVLEVQPDRLRIMHSFGVTSIDFEDLPDSLQKRYHYEPENAIAPRAQHAAEEKRAAEQPALIEQAQATNTTVASTPNSSPPAAASTKSLQAGTPPKPERGLCLSWDWDTNVMQGGSATIKDLRRLLSPHAQSARNTAAAPNIEIYRGVGYLMARDAAIQKLGLQGGIKSENRVVCPGFPRDSFSSYAFDGRFDGEYNRLYLVTDCADQVASIQLVCENPTRSGSGGSTDWYCYNFVNYRVKALPRIGISHQVGLESNGNLLRIESVLIDSKGRPAEAVRWFLPKPLAELILFCISNSEHRP